MELLAPAGNLEKLKLAIDYGADAVYCGMEGFSLRAKSGNFDLNFLAQGIEYAHKKNKKLYLALNIFAHNEDIEKINEVIPKLKNLEIDAFIISDLGVIKMLRNHIPEAKIHISTQANSTNYLTAKFYEELGIKRVILARELTFEEILEIKQKTKIELEIFVHGAMCISYSGRCLISDFITGRSANKGDCTHPCRWEYRVDEKLRPDQYFPVTEDGRYTYFFNSKDLNLIEEIPQIRNSEIHSIKLEGRNKGLYYLGMVVRAYREAIDNCLIGKDNNSKLLEELDKISNRSYCKGFFYGNIGSHNQNYFDSNYIRKYDFIGIVKDFVDGYAITEIRGKVKTGEIVEICSKKIENDFSFTIKEILNLDDKPIDFTKPNSLAKILCEGKADKGAFVRKERGIT